VRIMTESHSPHIYHMIDNKPLSLTSSKASAADQTERGHISHIVATSLATSRLTRSKASLAFLYGLSGATTSCEDATLAVPMVKVVAPEPSGITKSFP
jgi:hypothetical protein